MANFFKQSKTKRQINKMSEAELDNKIEELKTQNKAAKDEISAIYKEKENYISAQQKKVNSLTRLHNADLKQINEEKAQIEKDVAAFEKLKESLNKADEKQNAKLAKKKAEVKTKLKTGISIISIQSQE